MALRTARPTVAAVRAALARVVQGRGRLLMLEVGADADAIDIDDHVSDETVGGGRLRVLLRSPADLRALARALDAREARAARPKVPARTK